MYRNIFEYTLEIIVAWTYRLGSGLRDQQRMSTYCTGTDIVDGKCGAHTWQPSQLPPIKRTQNTLCDQTEKQLRQHRIRSMFMILPSQTRLSRNAHPGHLSPGAPPLYQ